MRPLAATIGGWLRTAPSARFVWLSLLGIAIVHAAIWFAVGRQDHAPLEAMLRRYDASWYLGIARDGYSGDEWAFYPLWPALVAVASRIVPLAMPFVQALLAVLCFLLSVRFFFTREELRGGLAPATRLGWLLFVLAPASYVFHTGHTESLFLLLSMSALLFCARGAWATAACLAGLAALTRNQGVFLAAGVAVSAARRAPRGLRSRRFVLSALLSSALFALYPIYQYAVSGDAFRSVEAQAHWSHSTSLRDVVFTFVLGNARTLHYEGYRQPIYLALLAATILHFRARRDVGLTVYFALSLAVLLAQRNLSNLFRFSVALAPLLFFAGDWLAERRTLVALGVLSYSAFLHFWLAARYPAGLWAY